MAPSLKMQASGTLPFPWAQFISRTGISPESAAFSWKGGSQAAMVLDFNFGDVVNPSAILSGALQQIIGYATFSLPAIGGIALVGGVAPTSMALQVNTFPDESGNGGVNWTAYNGSWVMTQVGGIKWVATQGGVSVTLQPFGPPVTGLVLTFAGGPGGNVDYTAPFEVGQGLGEPIQFTLDQALPDFLPETLTVYPSTGGTAGLINRTLPLQHPMFPNLWATRITKVEYYGPGQKIGGASATLIPYMGWRQARVYVLFEALNYALLTDAQLIASWQGNEFFRYVEGPMHVGELSALQRQASSSGGFQWNNPGPGGPAGAINFGVTQLLYKARIKLVWRMIPEEALYGSSRMQGGWPRPAFAVAGCVNSDTWLNFPPGSLLGGPGVITPVPSPFPLNSFTQYPQRLFDVEFPLHYFAPPGQWNRVPWAGDGNWYEIRIPPPGQPVANGRTLYPVIKYNSALFVPYGAVPSPQVA